MPESTYRSRGPSVANLKQKRADEEAAREADRAAREVALLIVERYAERSVLWSPTIRRVIAAGTPWLDVYCPGCRTSRALDIRALDRHPLASVGSVVLGLRWTWCQGGAPMMPVLTGLHALPPIARWSKSMPMEFLHGRPLIPEDLELIHEQIESFDEITAVDDEIRGIVARN
jgi:hypothetical protein